MKDLMKNTKTTLMFKEIVSNDEKLKAFEMRIITKQQDLILNNNLISSEYLNQLSKLLKKKDKEHYMYKRFFN